jgi:phage tail sheath protein FI
MAFQHGVYIQELDTKILGVRTCDSALPFVVGVAPVQTLTGQKPINEPKLIFSYKDYIQTFGEVPEGQSEANYSLSQFARIYFTLYAMSPAIFVNVFDPNVHKTEQNPDPTKVTSTDIIGGYNSQTGKRTGLETIEEVFSSFGKVVGIVLAPGYSHNESVANAMIAKAETLVKRIVSVHKIFSRKFASIHIKQI